MKFSQMFSDFWKMLFAKTFCSRVVAVDGDICFVAVENGKFGYLNAEEGIPLFPGQELQVMSDGCEILCSYVCQNDGRCKLELICKDGERWLARICDSSEPEYGFLYHVADMELKAGHKVFANVAGYDKIHVWKSMR